MLHGKQRWSNLGTFNRVGLMQQRNAFLRHRILSIYVETSSHYFVLIQLFMGNLHVKIPRQKNCAAHGASSKSTLSYILRRLIKICARTHIGSTLSYNYSAK